MEEDFYIQVYDMKGDQQFLINCYRSELFQKIKEKLNTDDKLEVIGNEYISCGEREIRINTIEEIEYSTVR